ncbi:uncharacterized protein LOC126833303 [Adelges cooleyi]|uniref:uncharacterized protein LOC126833303 n=1 Tax=Adelges cooleyi TaxID=133065 RepID=UPI0021800A52|nr:uncharacterized protein LOC126833303 [Adelges cooleyi]
MNVFFVLLLCPFLNVLASSSQTYTPRRPTRRTPDKLTKANKGDRNRLKFTNVLIDKHILERTIRNKIIHFVVRLDEEIMKKMTFMFALPERSIDEDLEYQKALEEELQLELNREFGLIPNEVIFQAGSRRATANDLGAVRRGMMKLALKSFITDIRDKHRTNSIDFTHTCRIIGLFWSMRFPDEYTTNADVEGEVCVIRHKEHIQISCAFYEGDICFVNNENHDLTGGSIIPCLN